jgi:predicted phage terminase large subunit-like protein
MERLGTTLGKLASDLLKRTVLDNPYVPIVPTAKQAIFLTLPLGEALYGGSAGGGKSVALLAGAMQFVDVPGYRALLLRRSYTDLNLPEALIPMSQSWLRETDAEWNGRQNEWTFPSGATVTFGYLDGDADKYRYQGAAFQYIGFDELTQFHDSAYRYLFSRLRRTIGTDVPLRVRAATNPGGVGHNWVRKRFIDQKHPDRMFIPAQLEDNPHLDIDAYAQALTQLDPVTRQQLRHGDWMAHEAGLFARNWFRYYRLREGGYGVGDRQIDFDACSRYATIDVACSEQRDAGHDPDWTVIQVWDLAATGEMFLRDQWRGRVSIPEVEAQALKMKEKHELPWLGVESAGIGQAVLQSLKHRGLSVRPLKANANKIIRSQSAQIRMEGGMMFFPVDAVWLDDLETELALFPHGQHDDQVDALSHAAYWAQKSAGPVGMST